MPCGPDARLAELFIPKIRKIFPQESMRLGRRYLRGFIGPARRLPIALFVVAVEEATKASVINA
jgi:hypothetical protein